MNKTIFVDGASSLETNYLADYPETIRRLGSDSFKDRMMPNSSSYDESLSLDERQVQDFAQLDYLDDHELDWFFEQGLD